MIYLYDFIVIRKKKSKLLSKYLFYRKKYFKQSFSGTSMVECEDVTYTTTGRFIIFNCKFLFREFTHGKSGKGDDKK